MDDERWLQRLARGGDVATTPPARAPARLKAKIYSALVQQLSHDGPLLGLAATKASSGLCVFEEVLVALPVGEGVRSMNPCRVCHARILAERVEHAPIFWPHCPYSAFHRSGE
jgi:hypothetical protein